MDRKLVLAAVAFAALACGKQTFLVAAFVQTPALPNPQDPSGTIPQLNVLTAYFGTIDTTNPTRIDASKEAPITDAIGSVAFNHVGKGGTDVDEPRVLKVPHQGAEPGTYLLSSATEPRLTFETGVPYTLVLQAGDDAYGARFVPAPPGDIAEFAAPTAVCHVTLQAPLSGTYNAPRCLEHAISTPLTLTRTDLPAAGQDPLPAFVLVGRIDPAKPAAEPQITFKTVPDSADKLLKYVLSDRDYRKTSFVADATAFPQSGYYIVSLLVAKQGKVSGNAFLGSTALAASGSAGIVHVP